MPLATAGEPSPLPHSRPAEPFPEEVRHTTALGVSPSSGKVPLWVLACALFSPPPVDAADRVVTASAVLMASTARVQGDLAVRLSPMRLALLCGFERPEKAKWLTDYLQEIGFLKVVDGGVNPRTGRRQARRDAKGRPIENEFLVFPEPPPHYCGPRTLAEIDALIAEDVAAAELEHERRAGSTKRSKPRAISIRRRTLFGTAAGQSTPLPGGMGGTVPFPGPPDRGDGRVSAVQTILSLGGMDSGSRPPAGGDGYVYAGQPFPPAGGSYQIDRRSSISEGEIEERSIEPVPGGAAKPPAPGLDERRVAAVRELVRRLPWSEWARLRQPEFRLTRGDADAMQAAICDAVAGGITLEDAAAIGQAALGEARSNPVGYVTDAFRKHLPRRLRALAVEPLSDDPLPLPGAAKPQGGPAVSTKQRAAAGPAAPESHPVKPVRPACETCGARAGEGLPFRTVTRDGREHACPDCRPRVS